MYTNHDLGERAPKMEPQAEEFFPIALKVLGAGEYQYKRKNETSGFPENWAKTFFFKRSETYIRSFLNQSPETSLVLSPRGA